MKVFAVDARKPDLAAVRAAADALRRGELIVFPTETVYGLAADAANDAAVRRVFEAKGRGRSSALPVQIARVDDLNRISHYLPDSAWVLAQHLWPGPLTLVVPKAPCISNLVTGGSTAVGVRIPNHAVALALLREIGAPIVATSANLSGTAPPSEAKDAVGALAGSIAVVLDAGPCEIGAPSTVVDLCTQPPRVLRHGAIDMRQITDLIGEIEDGGE